MRSFAALLGAFLLVGWLGCTTISTYHYESKVTSEPGVDESRLPPPRSAATAALLREADDALGAGESERAASILERALRVDSGDPVLWSRLADVRLRQERWEQAEQMARKSNQLASQDERLRRRNWHIIAHARRMRGDEAGARDAEAKADG
jgi:predicted Zn-dependent protease